MNYKRILVLIAGVALSASAVSAATTTFEGNLEVKGTIADPQDGVWFTGTYGVGTFPASLQGSGVKLVWFPRIGAFRAGNLSTFYNDPSEGTNVGYYSAAFGSNTQASGSSSFAVGSSTQATGGSAFAAGGNTTATGSVSTAFGGGSDATGTGSFAAGINTGALAPVSVAVNLYTIASGNYSFAAGNSSEANSRSEFVVGEFNEPSNGSPTTRVATDPVFVIGNGTDSNNLSNAVTVLKDGSVGIGTSTPDAALDVQGDATFGGEVTITHVVPQGDILMGDFGN